FKVFQKTGREYSNIFDIPYYKVLKKYLQFLGQDPYQECKYRNIITIIMLISMITIFIPTIFEIYVSIHDKNTDAVMECLPNLCASMSSVVKILNVHFNRENFNKLLKFVVKEWEELKLNELHILEEITNQGSKIAHLYRNTLLSFLILFLSVPMYFPILDMIDALNQTRSRQQLLRVNYMVFNADDYFFYVYLQLAWGAIVIVMIVVTIDSLYIIIIHHICGLFAVCSYEIQKTIKDLTVFANIEKCSYKELENCVIKHKKAIEFYNILNNSSQLSYLLQIGINIMGISTTAFQLAVNLDTRPQEAIRNAVFCGANQFHLFVLSLPGQILLDHCTELSNTIYCSMWYKLPVKIQKIFNIMLMRSKKSCALTVYGLYELNMENFGIVCNITVIYIYHNYYSLNLIFIIFSFQDFQSLYIVLYYDAVAKITQC
ncbi:uncharacterized protein LOC107999654, partial [Apis cerana]|uniref:uncharacterized protein LOC107999654 n=1 Tax=Apis cerana TaxID=7461 RepID=UPI002B221EB9